MNEWVELSNALAMPQADVETRLEEEIDFLNESYVYVHCSLPHCEPGMLVRIWRTPIFMISILQPRQSSFMLKTSAMPRSGQ